MRWGARWSLFGQAILVVVTASALPQHVVAGATGDALTIPTRLTVKTRNDALRGSRETSPLHPVDASPVVKLEPEVVGEGNRSVGVERKTQGSAGGQHRDRSRCSHEDPACKISSTAGDLAILTACSVVSILVVCLAVCWCRMGIRCRRLRREAFKDPFSRGEDDSIVRATFCGTLASVVCVSDYNDAAGEDGGIPCSQPCTPRPLNAIHNTNNQAVSAVQGCEDTINTHVGVSTKSGGVTNNPPAPVSSSRAAFTATASPVTPVRPEGTAPWGRSSSAGLLEGVVPEEEKRDETGQVDLDSGGVWGRWVGRKLRGDVSRRSSSCSSCSASRASAESQTRWTFKFGIRGRSCEMTRSNDQHHLASSTSEIRPEEVDTSDAHSVFSHKRRRAKRATVVRRSAARLPEAGDQIGRTAFGDGIASVSSTAGTSVFDSGSSVGARGRDVEADGRGGATRERWSTTEREANGTVEEVFKIRPSARASAQLAPVEGGSTNREGKVVGADGVGDDGEPRRFSPGDGISASPSTIVEVNATFSSSLPADGDTACDDGGAGEEEQKREVQDAKNVERDTRVHRTSGRAVVASSRAEGAPSTQDSLPRAKPLWRAFAEVDHDKITENHRLATLRHLARRTARSTQPNPQLWHFPPREYPPI